VPPKPPWDWSTVTAIATFGSWAGANATNDGCVRFRPLAPIDAVPVLPATLMPESWTAVPVPSSTTLVIIWVTSCAVVGLITCEYTLGVIVFTVTPSLLTTRLVKWGTISLPPLATAAATIAICSGVVLTPPSPIPIRPMSSSGLPGRSSLPVVGE
jgi:hypothetical protein